MNPNYTEFQFPQIKAHPWSKVFSKRLPPDAVDLVGCCPVHCTPPPNPHTSQKLYPQLSCEFVSGTIFGSAGLGCPGVVVCRVVSLS